ncbi:MAG: hypothetical protein ACOH5I_17735 [Oligoflexus sp.]
MPKGLHEQRRLQPVLTSERLKNWGFWLLIVLGILIIVSFFQWWVKRGDPASALEPTKVGRSSSIGKSLPIQKQEQ